MSQDAREQARHISEVTKAFAEGKAIQFKFKTVTEWMDCEGVPKWLFDAYDYRVKPEERKHEKLAELLKRIGWKDTGDAQWENLEKAMPGIRWLLAPDDEERKPREFKICVCSDGSVLDYRDDGVRHTDEVILVREVLPETETE